MTIGGIGQSATSAISRSAMMNATSIAIMNRDPAFEAVLHDPFAEWFAMAISDEARDVIASLQTSNACRELIVRIEAENAQPGISTHHIYRKPWVTQRVRDAISVGVEQVVILGAGLDTLSLRLERELGGMAVFEVDTPAVIEYRCSCIEAHRSLPDGVTPVAIDFAAEVLGERLRAEGYDPRLKSLFLAEGVMEWLPEDAVQALIAFVRGESGPASRFIFSFIPPSTHADGNYAHIRADNARSGEVWKFALRADALDSFLRVQGLHLIDFADPAHFERDQAKSLVPFDVLDFLYFAYVQTSEERSR
jgi:methyltransferase (TIGR00027 family)